MTSNRPTLVVLALLSLAGLAATPHQAFAQPDAGQSSVEPWDTLGKAMVYPGNTLDIDEVTVTVRNAAGTLLTGTNVTIDFIGHVTLCIEGPDSSLTAISDSNGEARFNPRIGGCDVCLVEVRADGVLLSSFSQVISQDWDGVQADGIVNVTDAAWFTVQLGTNEACADYNSDGIVDYLDGAITGPGWVQSDRNPTPCAGIADPDYCLVEPWDTYGQVFVSPGVGSVDTLCITVHDAGDNPLAGALVEVVFTGCNALCFSPGNDYLSATADGNGVVYIDPEIGGCDVCLVEVFADGVLLRSFNDVVSPDWDGTQADGAVTSADQSWFSTQLGGPGACADYDGNGTVTVGDFSLFNQAFGDANTGACTPATIASVHPAQGSYGSIPRFTGSGLGTDPDRVLAMLVGPGNIGVPLDVLSAEGDHLFAVVGLVDDAASGIAHSLRASVAITNSLTVIPTYGDVQILGSVRTSTATGDITTGGGADYVPYKLPDGSWDPPPCYLPNATLTGGDFLQILDQDPGPMLFDLAIEIDSPLGHWKLHYELVSYSGGTRFDLADRVCDLIELGLSQATNPPSITCSVVNVGGDAHITVSLDGADITSGYLDVECIRGAPVINDWTSIDPEHVLRQGDPITINGTGFGTSAGRVSVVGIPDNGDGGVIPFDVVSVVDTAINAVACFPLEATTNTSYRLQVTRGVETTRAVPPDSTGMFSYNEDALMWSCSPFEQPATYETTFVCVDNPVIRPPCYYQGTTVFTGLSNSIEIPIEEGWAGTRCVRFKWNGQYIAKTGFGGNKPKKSSLFSIDVDSVLVITGGTVGDCAEALCEAINGILEDDFGGPTVYAGCYVRPGNPPTIILEDMAGTFLIHCKPEKKVILNRDHWAQGEASISINPDFLFTLDGIGSSGEDGIGIDMGTEAAAAFASGFVMELDPLLLGPNQELNVRMLDFYNQPLSAATVSGKTTGLDFVADFTSIGCSHVLVELWAGGVLVDSDIVSPGVVAEMMSPARIINISFLSLGAVWKLQSMVPFETPPGDAPVLANEIRIKAAGCARSWDDRLKSVVINATNTDLAVMNEYLLPPCPLVSTGPGTNIATGPLAGTLGHSGVGWGDYDGDGDHDLYVSRNGPLANALFRNDGGGNLVDVTPPALGLTAGSRGVSWGDFDEDGDLDLYVVNTGGSADNVIFRNDGGGLFADVSAAPIDNGDAGSSVAWADYDLDGDIDCYLTNNGATNRLFRNEGGFVFTDVTPAPLAVPLSSYSASWADYDNDCDPDLYVGTTTANSLFRNEGAGVFVDVTTPALANATGSTQGISWGDYDNDGDLDLYVANTNESNRLLRNDGGGGFVDVTAAPLDLPALNCRGAGWKDVDNDGDLDLYVSSLTANTLLRNDGGGAFSDITSSPWDNASTARGLAWADLEGDGDQDLYVANDGGASVMIRNDEIALHHWLQVDLQGTVSNSHGVGARILVEANGLTQIREVNGGPGLYSNDALTAAFGLGCETMIDYVRVKWPSGLEQLLTGVTADQRIVIVEPDPGIGDTEPPHPTSFALRPSVPNPFQSATEIRFSLPEAAGTRLHVFDLRGRLVRELLDGSDQPAGEHRVQWDGRDASGRTVSPGVYFYRLTTPQHVQARKVIKTG